eukprot:CAMPEP_0115891212 /NCGR_PEP_ID=MMETSP0287-20121206/33746_1 /TAXON_ID=412157 /ORGANISM="Chrysochromulina rotalis, Strain UIO044" /LENGTH=85 /DNA_ID=CAMNT_0003347999 /DNA_START=284 /DNA_END=541 /DNA_ORIENTATION=+
MTAGLSDSEHVPANVHSHATHQDACLEHSAQHACQQRTRPVHIGPLRGNTAIRAEGISRGWPAKDWAYFEVTAVIQLLSLLARGA